METFKQAEVVMLSTDNRAPILKSNNGLSFNSFAIKELCGDESYHNLYFLAEDVISAGDFILEKTGLGWYVPVRATKEHLENEDYTRRCKKIIATTDTSIWRKEAHSEGNIRVGFPAPSLEFIQRYIDAYNEGNPIGTIRLKINANNTVNIK